MSTVMANNGYEAIRPVTDEEVRAFVMPVPKVGQAIVHYPQGLRGEHAKDLGFVVKIGSTSLGIRTAIGRYISYVPHADDPRLHKNAAQRENGSWDFTPYDKSRESELQDLRERLDMMNKHLMGQLNGLKGALAKKGILKGSEETKDESAS